VRGSNRFFCCTVNHSLSLSLFEALRRLRDAVSPADHIVEESDNTTTSRSPFEDTNQDLPDYEEFLLALLKDDPHVLRLLESYAGNHPPKSREEYVKFAAKIQMEKDMALVSTLSKDVFMKSDAIDFWLTQIPGLHRNRQEQMNRIEQLIKLNKVQEDEWKLVYQEGQELQSRMREKLQSVTYTILPIQQGHTYRSQK